MGETEKAYYYALEHDQVSIETIESKPNKVSSNNFIYDCIKTTLLLL